MFWYVSAFFFGAAWGSFFNVAIYRWPRDMSVVTPPSHCPSCGKPVPWYRNLPILGYVFLRGRAACCGVKLSLRYVFVEVLTACLAVAIVRQFLDDSTLESLQATAIESLIYFVLVGGLIIATFVDLEWMIIPDEVTLPGAAVGLATVTLRAAPGAEDAAMGAGIGFLLVQVPFVWIYERLLGRRGMGEGDSKLLLMIGAFLGVRSVLFSLVAASFQGLMAYAVMTIVGKARTPKAGVPLPASQSTEAGTMTEVRPEVEPVDEANEHEEDLPLGQRKMPFGPFLALGALEYLFLGNWIFEQYAALFAR